MKQQIVKLPTTEYQPAELRSRVEGYNAEAASVEAARAALDAREAELRDVTTLTAGNAAARVKDIGKAKVERVALLARVRLQAVEALAVLAEVQAANVTEQTRIAGALRAAEIELREGMARLNIGEELAYRKAAFGDPKLNALRGQLAQVGQGHVERIKMVSELLEKTTAEIAAMLKA